MFSNISNTVSQRAVSIYCIITLIYMPAILIFLYYTENIYFLDRYGCVTILIGLLLAECAKFAFCFLALDHGFTSKDSKTMKSKKGFKTKIKEILKCIYVIIGATALFYVLAVLFGAPILAECEETLTFAVLVSTLAIFPSCLNLGADNTVAILTGLKLPLNNIGDMILKSIQLTLLGAWLGALVIPLDWDRPWQVWPIPCCTGAVVGYIISNLFTLVKDVSNVFKVFKRLVA